MTLTTSQDIFIVGTLVQIFDRYWQSGFRVAALTDSGKVYVERNGAHPGRGLLLVKSENVRLPK